MEFIDAVILGVVQGFTEFLPVSSSGHLVLMQKILGFKEHSVRLDVALHLGTLLSLVTVYFRHIQKITLDVVAFPKTRERTLPLKAFLFVCLGSVPTAIMGLGAKDLFVSLFSEVQFVGGFLLITGVILFLTRYKPGDQEELQGTFNDFKGFETMTPLKALVIGFVQGLAIAPGISRSGATIAMGLFLGLNRSVAAHFSFLLSIPAILGASFIELRDINLSDELGAMLVAVLVSYVAGLIGLMATLFFVKKARLEVFSFYLWALGLGVIILW